MQYTQTISTEYHPCEILPVVFGAIPTSAGLSSGSSPESPPPSRASSANPAPNHPPPALGERKDMSNHTKEPWKIVGGPPLPYTQIIAGQESIGKVVAGDNGPRICACVNALAGVDDPAAFVAKVRELLAKWSDEDAMSLNDCLGELSTMLPIGGAQ